MLLAFFFACFCALGLLGAAAVPLERRQYWFGETGVYDAINCVNPRHLALTFDDGPSSFTPTLLNYLRQKNVKATFFVVGSQVDALPQILVQAFNEGHQIASHTYSHPSLPSLGSAAILSELQRTEQAIVSRIGVAPVYMRPPYGDVDQRTGTVIRSFGEKITVWSFDSNDWRYTGDSQAVIDSFASLPPPSSGPGVIALAHDIHSWTVEAMPAVIDLLRGKGYQLVTLSECLGGAAAYKGVSPTFSTRSTSATQVTSTRTTSTAQVTSTITTSVAATSTRPTTTTTASPGGSCPSGCGTGVYWATGKCINSVCVCSVGWGGPACQDAVAPGSEPPANTMSPSSSTATRPTTSTTLATKSRTTSPITSPTQSTMSTSRTSTVSQTTITQTMIRPSTTPSRTNTSTSTASPSACDPRCGAGVYWATGKCVSGKCVCFVGWTGPGCTEPGFA